MKKQIQQKVEILKEVTGLNLHAEYASYYGGWRLVGVREGGSEFGVFGESSACERMKSKEFLAYVSGLVNGLNFKK